MGDCIFLRNADPYAPPPTSIAVGDAFTPVSWWAYALLMFGGFWTLIAVYFGFALITLPIMYPGLSDPSVPHSHWPRLNFYLSSIFAAVSSLIGVPALLFAWRRLRVAEKSSQINTASVPATDNAT